MKTAQRSMSVLHEEDRDGEDSQQLVVSLSDTKLDSEARATVARSLEVARALREDNDYLKEAYDALTQELTNIVQRNETLEREKAGASQSKGVVEQECQALYRRWTNELKVQSERFKEIEVEMVPASQLELVREKLLIEMEGPHRQLVTQMEQRMQEYRAQSKAATRELQLLRGELRYRDTEHEIELQAMEESQTSSLERLRKRNRKLQEDAENTAPADELRLTERANADLIARIDDLRQQLATFKERSTGAMVEHERRQMEMSLESTHLTQELEVRQRGFDMLKKLNASLTQDLEKARVENTRIQEQEASLSETKQRLEQELASKEERMVGARRRLKEREEELARESDQQLGALREQVAQARKSMLAEQAKLDETKQALRRNASAEENAVAKWRADHKHRFQALAAEKAELEERMYQIEAASTTQMQKSKEDLLALQQDLEKERSAVRTLEASSALSRQKLGSSSEKVSILEANSRRQEQELREVTAESEALHETHRRMARERGELQRSVKTLESQKSLLEEQVETASGAAESRRAQHLDQIEGLSTAIGKSTTEMQSDNGKLTTTIGAITSAHEQQLRKLKAEKLRYKKLALMSKMQLETMTGEYSEVTKKTKKWRASTAKEVDQLRDRLREAERERDECQFKLSMKQVTRDR